MKSKFFQMRVDEAFLRRLDDARRVEPDLPSRTAMVRRLVEWALVARKPLTMSLGSVRQGQLKSR